jgi:glucose/arabinose dehydrogenase
MRSTSRLPVAAARVASGLRAAAPLALALAAAVVIVVVPAASPVAAASVSPGFTDSLVATAQQPTAVETLPDGRIVVLEQAGRVRTGFPGQALGTALDITGPVCSGGERGLLGFTHDPAFLSTGHVFVYYTREAPDSPGGCVNRVSRFTMSGSVIDPASEAVLLDGLSSVNGNHNAGDLDIGSDGFLYVTTGDAGRDPRGDSGAGGGNNAAQDLSLLNGKILRITRDGAPAPGNPIGGAGTEPCALRGNLPTTPTTSCQELFAWGLRNPYRFAFDPNGGGDRFFINDVGQSAREEVDDGGIGRNYGWNACEGPCPPGVAAANGFTDPITSYPRTDGTYVTAGAFVPNGFWPPAYDGAYLFADGGSGDIWVRHAAGALDYTKPFATGAASIADMVFGFDEAGRMALFYTLSAGQLRKITWTGQTPSPTPANLAFDGIAPLRVYDTRDGTGVIAGDVRSGTTRLVDLPAPAGARAALVNLTVTNNAGWGFVEAWAPRSLRPPTSVINVVRPVEDVANAVVVALDGDGRFVLHATTATDVVVDVLGWFADTPGAVGPGRFVSVDPARLVDTRKAAGSQLGSGSSNEYTDSSSTTTGRVDVPVGGRLGVPGAADVDAVVVVLTALGEARSGFATAHAGGTPTPLASNVNVSGDGDIRANLVVVPLAPDGTLSVSRERVTDVIVDVAGYFTSSSAPSSSSGLFSVVAPARVYDERSAGAPAAPAGATLTVGSNALGASSASAVLQNLTMTSTTGFDFVTAFPAGGGVPVVSNVNATAAGQTRAALAVTRVGTGGVGYFTFGESQLIVDVFGTFSR